MYICFMKLFRFKRTKECVFQKGSLPPFLLQLYLSSNKQAIHSHKTVSIKYIKPVHFLAGYKFLINATKSALFKMNIYQISLFAKFKYVRHSHSCVWIFVSNVSACVQVYYEIIFNCKRRGVFITFSNRSASNHFQIPVTFLPLCFQRPVQINIVAFLFGSVSFLWSLTEHNDIPLDIESCCCSLR